MPAAIIKGTATSFGILSGGTAAVAYTGKKNEFSLEGYATATNSVTQGGTLTPSSTGLTSFNSLGGLYVVEEVTATKSAEDFLKIKYKIVERDGI